MQLKKELIACLMSPSANFGNPLLLLMAVYDGSANCLLSINQMEGKVE